MLPQMIPRGKPIFPGRDKTLVKGIERAAGEGGVREGRKDTVFYGLQESEDIL